MSQRIQLNRRTFLRTAGMTALAGAAVGTGTALATETPGAEPPDGIYDFDTPYDRSGTACIKWDSQFKKYGKENIEVGMGIADMDFQAAPCIARALEERCKHQNWGYTTRPASLLDAIADWNKTRHGIDPELVRTLTNTLREIRTP